MIIGHCQKEKLFSFSTFPNLSVKSSSLSFVSTINYLFDIKCTSHHWFHLRKYHEKKWFLWEMVRWRPDERCEASKDLGHWWISHCWLRLADCSDISFLLVSFMWHLSTLWCLYYEHKQWYLSWPTSVQCSQCAV